MQYNALIIDQQIESHLRFRDRLAERKQMVCRLDSADRLKRMYEAADKMDERPCLCLVVTDQTETAGIALSGGFETVTSEEYTAING